MRCVLLGDEFPVYHAKIRVLIPIPPITDQARPEADPCRSANPIQGHCHHR